MEEKCEKLENLDQTLSNKEKPDQPEMAIL